jgi:hypothetical protein
MSTSVLTRQEFTKKLAHADNYGEKEAVIVISEGVPTNVWLPYAEYEALLTFSPTAYPALAGGAPPSAVRERTLLDIFDHPAFDHLPEDFEFPKIELDFRPVDFS